MDSCNKSEDATSWEKFHVSISKEELYHEDDPMIDELLQDMTSLEFYNISKSSFHINRLVSQLNDFTNYFVISA